LLDAIGQFGTQEDYMDTIFVEENATRGEELTAPPSPHDRTAAQPERPLCTTVDMFVADVIYDGRFLDSFTTAPERVAEQLGIQPTPEVLEVLRGRDSRHVLSETTARMTRDYHEARKEPGRDPQAF